METGKKVDFIGIGAPKAGTSWVYQCLKEHSEVCVSSTKEIHFFNKNHGFHIKNPEFNYNKGLDWYFSHFNSCRASQILGEMDTRYLYEKEALLLIKKHFPDVKIIINLRNPADRAFSNYNYHIQKYPEYKKIAANFEKAINVEPEFLGLGKYYEYVKNCYEIFPKENIFIILFDDICKRPNITIQSLYNFLKIDKNFIPESLNKKINKGKKSINFLNFFKPLYGKIKNTKLGNSIDSSMFISTIKRPASHFFSVNVRKPEIKGSVKKYLLNEYFKKDILELSKLINQKLDKIWRK